MVSTVPPILSLAEMVERMVLIATRSGLYVSLRGANGSVLVRSKAVMASLLCCNTTLPEGRRKPVQTFKLWLEHPQRKCMLTSLKRHGKDPFGNFEYQLRQLVEQVQL